MAKELKDHNYFGIDATIIADSKNPQGDRITTMVVTIPRIVLAEFNTHRMFSRNSASSRAIPFEKMLERVMEHPFVPIAWQKDHKGMQGTEYLTNSTIVPFMEEGWLEARDAAVEAATKLARNELTKQLCNRLLEPFMWHTVIVTSTEWENFFKLRCPQYEMESSWGPNYYRSRKDYLKAVGLPETAKDYEDWNDVDWLKINKSGAEIHISRAAELMWDALNESTPKELQPGEWHIPFGDLFDEERLRELKVEDQPSGLYRIGDVVTGRAGAVDIDDEIQRRVGLDPYRNYKVMIATARCARVSYLNFEGKDDYEADIRLHEMLKENGHASPFEHCARAMNSYEYATHQRGVAHTMEAPSGIDYFEIEPHNSGWSRNFKGFIQYREIIES